MVLRFQYQLKNIKKINFFRDIDKFCQFDVVILHPISEKYTFPLSQKQCLTTKITSLCKRLNHCLSLLWNLQHLCNPTLKTPKFRQLKHKMKQTFAYLKKKLYLCTRIAKQQPIKEIYQLFQETYQKVTILKKPFQEQCKPFSVLIKGISKGYESHSNLIVIIQ